MEIRKELNNIDWNKILRKLPTDKTDKEQALERKKLFKKFDPNGNGYLSLAEIDKGIRDVLELDQVFDCKPAIFRAFSFAKNYSKKGGVSDDYIEFKEFRIFLLSLRQFFEYYEAFDTIDTSNDRRISLEEFRWSQNVLQK